MALDSQFARPGTLQVIPHSDAKTPQALGLQLDDVAMLKRIQSAVVRSRRQNIAGHQCLNGTDPSYAVSDAGNHLACIEVLFDLAIDPQTDLQVLGIRNFIARDDVRADRRKRIARFHLKE